jgi:hypothetical protein
MAILSQIQKIFMGSQKNRNTLAQKKYKIAAISKPKSD